MATSTKQVVATVPVYDYVQNPGDAVLTSAPPLAGKQVKVTLAYDKARSISPVTWLENLTVYSTKTDANGFWQVNVVPTDNITPANTYYIVEVEGYLSYKINPLLAGVPGVGWQSSAILLDIPASLTPAGQTITGPLTVTGTLAVTGLFTVASTTGMQVNAAGDISGRSLTLGLVSPYLATAANGGQDIGGPLRVKNKPWFDVTHPDFGAKADGTNDAARIQLAYAAAAAGGTVIYPAGTYTTTANITVSSFTQSMGVGYLSSVIAPSAAVTRAFDTTGATQKVFFSNLDITGAAAIGLYIISTIGCIVEQVRCRNMTSIGADLNASNAVTFRYCWFENITSYGIRLLGSSNQCQVEDCSFNAQAQAGSGILIGTSIQATHVMGCNFEGNANGNLGINCSGSLNTVIDGANYFEQWTGGCIAANSGVARGLVIRGNALQATSAAAACIILNSAGPNLNVEIAFNDYPTLGNGGMTAVDVNLGSTVGVKMWGNTSGGSAAVSPDVFEVLGQIRRARQTPTEAVLVSGINAATAELVGVTLTAARLVGAPLNPAIGQRLTFTLIQGGAGAFAVTWNAIFKKTWADAGNAAGARSSISFFYDGTNWNQDGAQAPYV